MNNILLDELPTSYEGYPINSSFRIGIMICLALEDIELTRSEQTQIVCSLLLGDEDGVIKNIPDNDTLQRCIEWFLSGWNHDNEVESEHKNIRLMDYDIDQFRIYADFLSIYGLDLNTVDLHWWAFQGLLWNMPFERSSFLQAIEIRTKKPRKGASMEERKAIEKAHKHFDLKQNKKVEFTKEEEAKIDAFDALMKGLNKK